MLDYGEQKSKMITINQKRMKGAQLFSLDAMFALLLVSIIIVASVINLNKRTAPEDIQTSKVGYDILSILDYENYLTNLNEPGIQNRTLELLPPQYGMRIRLAGENFDAIEVGDTILQRFVASGKRSFVNGTNDIYGVATFWIWLK